MIKKPGSANPTGLWAFTLLIALAACSSPPLPNGPFVYPKSWGRDDAGAGAAQSVQTAKVSKIKLSDAGIDAASMDRSVAPCEDFYRFACGGWEKSFELPKGGTGYDKRFASTSDRVDERVQSLLESIPADTTDPNDHALRNFYRSCMDESRIEALGPAPLAETFKTIRAAKTREELAKISADLELVADMWFYFTPIPNEKDPTLGTASIANGGHWGVTQQELIGIQSDDAAARKEYEAHAQKLLRLTKMSAAEATITAKDAINLEKALAEAGSHSSHSKMLTVAQLETEAPGFPWRIFATELSVPDNVPLIVRDPNGAQHMALAFGKASVSEISHYLIWRWLVARSSSLSAVFRAEDAAWATHRSTASVPDYPRSRVCAREASDPLRLLVDAKYVAHYVSPEARSAARSLFRALREAADRRLTKLTWLDPTNRARATKALDDLTFDESLFDQTFDMKVMLRTDSFSENQATFVKAFARKRFAALGQKAALPNWQYDVLTPVVGLEESAQTIFLPPSLLDDLPPAPTRLAQLYATLGVGLSGAMLTSLSWQGRHFNGDGELVGWLSGGPLIDYESKRKCIAVEPLDSPHPPAPVSILDRVVSERGGVEVALSAFHNARRDAQEVFDAEGYSEDQQFFIAYAQSQCGKWSAERLQSSAKSKTELTPSERVAQISRGVPELRAAFQCEPQKHCQAW